MTPQQIDQAATALAAARRGQPIPELPAAVRPQSREDSFAIQDAVMAKLGEKPGGWKVGALPDGGNFIAPIYASAVLADNFSNGGLVYGAAASGWESADLVHPPIEVTADGKPFADCTGLRAGNPTDLLVTAVNLAAARGGVAAGTFVTTGTHTGLVFAQPGTRIRADYGRFG